MENILKQVYLGNSVEAYAMALITFIAGIIIVYIFKKIVLSRLEKWAKRTETELDDLLIKGIEKSIVPLLYFGAFYIAVQTLSLSIKAEKTLRIISVILLTFYFLRSLTAVLNHAFKSYLRRKQHGEERIKQMHGITTLLNILIWALGLMFLLDNLGFKISTVTFGTRLKNRL